MKRLAFIAVAGVAMLAAGIAVARTNDSKTVAKVAGQFTAAPATSKSESHTCTTTDGKSLTTTHATYTGAATGAADLTGPLTIDATSTIDTTDNVGEIDGHLTISPSGGGKTQLHLTGVYDGGTVVGLASGHSATHSVQVLANLSAGFSTAAGFTAGKIGGSAGGSAVEIGPGHCAPNAPSKETSHAEGSITAVSSSSISVAGLTCTVPASLAAKLTGLQVGSRVEIDCSLVSGVDTLTKIEAKKGH